MSQNLIDAAMHLKVAVDELLKIANLETRVDEVETMIDNLRNEVGDIGMGEWDGLDPDEVGEALTFVKEAPRARDLTEMMTKMDDVEEAREEVERMFTDFREEAAPLIKFIDELKSLFVRGG